MSDYGNDFELREPIQHSQGAQQPLEDNFEPYERQQLPIQGVQNVEVIRPLQTKPLTEREKSMLPLCLSRRDQNWKGMSRKEKNLDKELLKRAKEEGIDGY